MPIDHDLPTIETYFCTICERDYLAPLNATCEDCCPECLVAVERTTSGGLLYVGSEPLSD